MADELRVSRTVDASPEQLFAVLTTPSKHVEVDGAGMLRGQEGDDAPLRAVGDEFLINMNNQVLGDYQIKNTVVTYEPNRAIGWAPALWPAGGYTDKLGDIKTGGHTYTWHLQPEGEGRTKVTQVYEWNAVEDPRFRGLFPMLNEEQLGESIEKAARAAT